VKIPNCSEREGRIMVRKENRKFRSKNTVDLTEGDNGKIN
jgi:hypothetical protein